MNRAQKRKHYVTANMLKAMTVDIPRKMRQEIMRRLIERPPLFASRYDIIGMYKKLNY